MNSFLFFFLVTCMSFEHVLHAYTDPGSGMLLWQLLMASFIGGLFYFRQGWCWVKEKFKKKTTESSGPTDQT